MSGEEGGVGETLERAVEEACIAKIVQTNKTSKPLRSLNRGWVNSGSLLRRREATNWATAW